jgi:uncharacterized protein
MKIYLKEIYEQETVLKFTDQDPWVLATVLRMDEVHESTNNLPAERPLESSRAQRPVQAHFALRKVDEVYIVSGHLQSNVELICSRCAVPFQFFCRPHFSALFCKDPVLAGIAHLQRPERPDGHARGVGKPIGQNHGHARHAHAVEDPSDTLCESQDIDITYLSQDFIDLSDVLAEQIQLQLPFQPLCQDGCQGICTCCGTDLNKSHCSCAKTRTQTPFAILKRLDLGGN